MKVAFERRLAGRARDVAIMVPAALTAMLVGIHGVGHPKEALGLGVAVVGAALLQAWMDRGDPNTRAYRWVPLAWVVLFLVTDLRFDQRGPLEVAAGDIGAQHLIQVLVYGVVSLLIVRSRRSMLPLYPRAVPRGLLIAWPAVAVASWTWSLTPLYTFVRASQLLVLAALALLMVRIWLSDPIAGERTWFRTLRLYIQVVTLLALLGFILQPWTAEASLAAGRFTWPGAHPGHASTYLGCALVILLAGGRSLLGFSRVGYWSRVGLFGAGIYMGQTRSVVGGLVVGVGLAVWFLGREKPLARFLGIPYYVAGISILLAVAASQLADYLTRGEPLKTITTLNSRIPLWEFAISQLDSFGDWLVGFGYGSARQILLPEFQWAGSAHSSAVELLLGVGLLGLLLAAADLVVLGGWLGMRRGSLPANRIGVSLLGFLVVVSLVSEMLVLPGLGFGLLALLHVPVLAARGPSRDSTEGELVQGERAFPMTST